MRDFINRPRNQITVESFNDNLVLEPHLKVTFQPSELRVINTITCQGSTWFDGTVRTKRFLVIPSVEREEDVNIIIEGDLFIEDDLHVKGSVEVTGKLEINGDAIIFGNLSASSVKIGGKCHISGNLRSDVVEIDEDLQVERQAVGKDELVVNGSASIGVLTRFKKIIIEGRLRGENVHSCGMIDVYDDVKIERISNCRQFTCNGRLDADKIEQIDLLEIDDAVNVDVLHKVKEVIVRSSITVKNDLNHCDKVVVSGSLRVQGMISQVSEMNIEDGLRAEVIESTKVITCQGTLRAREISDINTLIVRNHLQSETITNVGALEVTGRLVAGSVINCKRMDVARSILVDNDVQALMIITGGNLDAGSVHGCETLIVAGEATIRSPCDINRAKIGKALTFAGGVVQELDVGGRLINEGELQAGKIRVGALFKSIGMVMIEHDLVVTGKARLDAPLRAESITIGAILDGQYLEAGNIHVGRQVMIHEGLQADFFSLGKEGRAMGTIVARKAHIQRNSIIDFLYAEHAIIERNVKARRLIVRSAVLDPHVEISEELVHVDELENIDRITCTHPPLKVDSLPPPPTFEVDFS